MENCPFIDDFPIKTSVYEGFAMAMSNNQMVLHIFFWSPTFISMSIYVAVALSLSLSIYIYIVYAYAYIYIIIYVCMYGYATSGCHVFIYYPKLPTGMNTPYIVLRKNGYGSKTSCQQSRGSKKKVGRFFCHATHTWQSSQARGARPV